MRIIQIYISLFILLSFLFACGKATTQGSFKNITSSEAQELQDKNADIIFLDVRTQEEIVEGKIQGAAELDFRKDNFKEEVATLDKSQTYVVYCRSGGRSAKASQMMVDMGFKDVSNLEGGFIDWSKNE